MTTKEPDTDRPRNASISRTESHEDSIDADQLFRGRKQVVITHQRDRYILRITRSGKLILNK